MKLLLFLGVVVLAVLLWRSGRRNTPGSDTAAPRSDGKGDPQEMVRCHHCGLHLPRGDAVIGRIGFYCGAEHRQAAEP